MKILISGYYGFGNAGDSLVLDSILGQIRAHDGKADITVLSASPSYTAPVHNVKSVYRWNWVKIFMELRKCDVLISGGGGLFQDYTGNIGLYYYLGIIYFAKLLKKKVFICAVGINELKKVNSAITAKVLRLADKITVREQESQELLAKWGCPREKIEVTADPVLSNEYRQRSLSRECPRIAIILRPPLKGRWQVDVFAKLADSLNQRLSARISFMAFHPSKDNQFTLNVINSMRSPARFIQWNNHLELYKIFGEMDMVISQRLHGLILGALSGLPLLGISEDTKITRFLQELGQKSITNLAKINPYSLLPVICDLWDWREEFRKNYSGKLQVFRKRSKRTAELLMETLKSI